MSAPIIIRRLTSADAALYRAIRLEMLARNPEAFGATLADEQDQHIEFFAGRLEGSAVFGALREGALLGTAGVYVERESAARKAVLWTVYVQSSARGTGLGRRLVEAVIEHTRRAHDALHLKVNSINEPALSLYTALGFERYGIDRNALERGGHFYDEVLMMKRLAPP